MIGRLFGINPKPTAATCATREFAPPTHVGTYSPGVDFRTGYADRMGGIRSRRAFTSHGMYGGFACGCPRCEEYQEGYDTATKDIIRKATP